jgi:hypothetical protein
MDEMDYRSNVLEVRRHHLPSFRLRRQDNTERCINIWDRRVAESKDGNFLGVGDSPMGAIAGRLKGSHGLGKLA